MPSSGNLRPRACRHSKPRGADRTAREHAAPAPPDQGGRTGRNHREALPLRVCSFAKRVDCFCHTTSVTWNEQVDGVSELKPSGQPWHLTRELTGGHTQGPGRAINKSFPSQIILPPKNKPRKPLFANGRIQKNGNRALSMGFSQALKSHSHRNKKLF